MLVGQKTLILRILSGSAGGRGKILSASFYH